jgi:hypothetical protein
MCSRKNRRSNFLPASAIWQSRPLTDISLFSRPQVSFASQVSLPPLPPLPLYLLRPIPTSVPASAPSQSACYVVKIHRAHSSQNLFKQSPPILCYCCKGLLFDQTSIPTPMPHKIDSAMGLAGKLYISPGSLKAAW